MRKILATILERSIVPIFGGAINAICQDRRGFIWVGSEFGLYRYDGKVFRAFSENVQQTSGGIGFLAEDSQGNLWAGSNTGGITIIDPDNFVVKTRMQHCKNKPGNSLISSGLKCISAGPLRRDVDRRC